jgi:hypothetical protein
MGLLESWQQWTHFLGEKVEDAKNDGVSSKMIDQAALQIGEYLAKNVEPQNEQERVLADLWSVASSDEKKALASCVVKLVEHKVS